MEKREAFTGISAEPEESIEEVNWRQNSYNQRGRGYLNGGSNVEATEAITISPAQLQEEEVIILLVTIIQGSNGYAKKAGTPSSNGYEKKAGIPSNPDVRCLICGLKGNKVITCRKLPRAQELIRQDKQQYWKNKKESGKRNTPHHNRKQQRNEVDEAEDIDEVDQYQDEDYDVMDYKGLDELIFPFSEYSKEQDQAYYNDN